MSVFCRAIKKGLGEDIPSLIASTEKQPTLHTPHLHAPATKAHAKADESLQRCSTLRHGTTTDRFTLKAGDTLKVRGEFYTTHNKNLAIGYSTGFQPSAFRPNSWLNLVDGYTDPDTASSKPLLVKLATTRLEDCQKYVKGNVHVFPHGVELVVVKVESPHKD